MYIKRILLFFLVSIFIVSVSAKEPRKPSPKTSKYNKHIKTAKGYGLPVLKTNKQILHYAKKNKLSKATCNKGCRITKLDYSRPYLVPKAERVMKEISNDFFKQSKKSTLTITSMTRSLQDQRRLTKVNKNARNGVSSHNYGCSFDISYVRFNNRLQKNNRLEKVLYGILAQYQKKGKIYFIKEKSQKCFHVTVKS